MADNPTSYPLLWPPAWPRKGNRRTARFSTNGNPISIAAARARLEAELDRMFAKNPVLSTNIELTLNGRPRSGQREPSDSGVALYFQRKGKDIVLACDHWDRVADNITAIAKHIEAIRGMERWGVGSVDQVFTGYTALPAPVAQKHWTSVLGLGDDASAEVINTRYRALSRSAANYPDGAEARQLMLNTARDAALLTRNGR